MKHALQRGVFGGGERKRTRRVYANQPLRMQYKEAFTLVGMKDKIEIMTPGAKRHI